MNFDKVIKLIKKYYNNITFTIKSQEKDNFELTANIASKKYDDGIYIEITVFDSGTIFVDFVFDKLDPTFENLKLCNDFNENLSFLWAAVAEINGNNYLRIRGTICNNEKKEAKIAEDICFLMDYCTGDTVEKYLKPLAARTYE